MAVVFKLGENGPTMDDPSVPIFGRRSPDDEIVRFFRWLGDSRPHVTLMRSVVRQTAEAFDATWSPSPSRIERMEVGR